MSVHFSRSWLRLAGRLNDLILGQTLEPHGLLLFVRNSAAAVITPKRRHALTAIDISMKPVSPKKPPIGFLG